MQNRRSQLGLYSLSANDFPSLQNDLSRKVLLEELSEELSDNSSLDNSCIINMQINWEEMSLSTSIDDIQSVEYNEHTESSLEEDFANLISDDESEGPMVFDIFDDNDLPFNTVKETHSTKRIKEILYNKISSWIKQNENVLNDNVLNDNVLNEAN